jgi:hypothetical protein
LPDVSAANVPPPLCALRLAAAGQHTPCLSRLYTPHLTHAHMCSPRCTTGKMLTAARGVRWREKSAKEAAAAAATPAGIAAAAAAAAADGRRGVRGETLVSWAAAYSSALHFEAVAVARAGAADADPETLLKANRPFMALFNHQYHAHKPAGIPVDKGLTTSIATVKRILATRQ